MEPADAAARGLALSKPLEVRDLPPEGLCYAEEVGAAELDRLLGEATRGPVRFAATGSGRARVDVHPLSEEEPPAVRVRGQLEAELDTSCVRCLEAVRLHLRAPVEATLYPGRDAPSPSPSPLGEARRRGRARGAVKAPPERAMGRSPPAAIPVEGGEPLEPWAETFPDPDELDEGVYDGLRIPLPDLIRQALLIELPSDPACMDESACDLRTAALIEAANAEARASSPDGDPRWAALRALRGPGDPDPSGSR